MKIPIRVLKTKKLLMDFAIHILLGFRIYYRQKPSVSSLDMHLKANCINIHLKQFVMLEADVASSINSLLFPRLTTVAEL